MPGRQPAVNTLTGKLLDQCFHAGTELYPFAACRFRLGLRNEFVRCQDRPVTLQPEFGNPPDRHAHFPIGAPDRSPRFLRRHFSKGAEQRQLVCRLLPVPVQDRFNLVDRSLNAGIP